MGPRKKARIETTAASDDNVDRPTKAAGDSGTKAPNESEVAATTPSKNQVLSAESSSSSLPNARDTIPIPKPDGSDSSSIRSSSGWYGSWKSKAPATTQIDGKSITTPNRSRTDLVENDKQLSPSPARYTGPTPGGTRRSSKSTLLAASTTKIHATSGTASDRGMAEEKEESTAGPPPSDSSVVKDDKEMAERNSINLASDASASTKDAPDHPATSEQATSSWRGWWSRPDTLLYKPTKEKVTGEQLQKDKKDAEQTPLPTESETSENNEAAKVSERKDESASIPVDEDKDEKGNMASSSNQNRLSWFYFWSKQQNAGPNEGLQQNEAQSLPEGQNKPKTTTETHDAAIQEPPRASENALATESKTIVKDAPSKASGWAFWSREKPLSDDASDVGSTHRQVGELAVADTPSQSRPEAAQFNERDGASSKDDTKKAELKTVKGRREQIKPKQDGAQNQTSTPAKGTPSASPTRRSTEDSTPKTKQQSSVVEKRASITGKSQPQGAAQLLSKTQDLAQAAHQRNIILPEFQSTYHAKHQKSYWDQLRGLIWRSGTEPPRIFYDPEPPKVQHALAIGVHGFFPAAMLRTVLGQPTGTSIRFANLAAAAIKEWVRQHGDYECEIEKAALEGEGFIADRVDTLWKLLLNWMDKIRKADLILVAAHSQGVPVAVMLVAKLIQFGCVNSNARIGICAMAGVNMGPFIEYRTSWLGGTANELFDFSRPDSKVSLMYEKALEVILGHGVRISYIGSIDDQLVSLESSTFTPITHPYIYRAVFVNAQLQQKPDFIASLVGFVLKLRNLGVSDHGLIRELSPALAGSLVSGDGHSRLYDDLNVYLLAVRSTLETTSLAAGRNPPIERSSFTGVALQDKKKEENSSAATGSAALSVSTTTAHANPYFLPWAMRGVLEEELVRKELGDECAELLTLFERWKPQSKGLKDVRFRLEAVRSKL